MDRYAIDTNVIIATMQGVPEDVAFVETVELAGSEVLYSVIVEDGLFSHPALTEDDKDFEHLLRHGLRLHNPFAST